MIKLAQKIFVFISIFLVSMSSLSVAAIVFAEEASAQGELKKCRGDRVKNNCFAITFQDGSKYEGEWKDRKKHGQGTLTWPDGRKFVGEFKDDNPHGQGTVYAADGTILKQGIYENGQPVKSKPN